MDARTAAARRREGCARIARIVYESDRTPRYTEIAEMIGVPFGTVKNWITAMVRRGELRRDRYIARSLRCTDAGRLLFDKRRLCALPGCGVRSERLDEHGMCPTYLWDNRHTEVFLRLIGCKIDATLEAAGVTPAQQVPA